MRKHNNIAEQMYRDLRRVIRSEAAKKGWRRRRRREAQEKKQKQHEKRSAAAKKGWETRRAKKVVPPQERRGYPEVAHRRTGESLLGYFENRPGIVDVVRAVTFGPRINRSISEEEKSDARERIEQLDLPDEVDRAVIYEAWFEAEDGGVELEVEIYYADGE